MVDQKQEPEAGPPEQALSLTLSNLEQIKVLADPLRIRMLECFCRSECTTKQVAQLLGEKPTKLYHHVDALLRVGLIRPTRTRQNRGTLEKYYLAVAHRFEADSSLFDLADSGSREEIEDLRAMVSMILGRTSQELSDLMGSGEAKRAITEEGLLSFIEIHADQPRIQKLRREIEALLKALLEDQPDCRDSTSPPGERYRLTLALFPLKKTV